ncbi:uncharacterized protein LOC142554013 isoform X1 [Primulina tabacum]|uniref:uncharacterized protein LOC142554013 isoform X1 n=1 Tax=Primulina tabacum TaxID=48773 RepID=UPI003F597FA2
MVARDLGDRSMFLAHVTQFYPKQLFGYPNELALFLNSSARCLPSGLRVNVTRALVLLANRKMIDIPETLVLFVELQTLGDRALKKLAFSHVIRSIWGMNRKHKNDPKNRALQNVLYRMLQQQEEEAKAKVALVTLCDLHRRKVWFDERTANAICMACFHSSSRIMTAALSFLLDFEKILDGDDSNDSGGEDDATAQLPQIALTKEAFYKASHKGTASSKKKKKAKLLRVARSMKKKQRLSFDGSITNNCSPLNHLKDTQGFAEKLLSRLQNCNERFEVKMMLLEVIARTVGLHRLILLNFYPYLQKYVQPYQHHIARLLCAAIQACHDMVPPDAVEPLFKQIVNQFVHDRSRPEAIAVGLRTVHEICLRMPLLMTEDLLQDLVLYDQSKEQGVRSAARALLRLFRVVFPSLLRKKDRGMPINPEARPKAYGEVNVASDIPDIELLEQGVDSDEDVDEESGASMLGEDYESNGGVGLIEKDGGGGENEGDLENKCDCSSDNGFEMDDNSTGDEPLHNEVSDEDDCDAAGDENDDAENSGLLERDASRRDDGVFDGGSKAQKRKAFDFEEQLNAADKSLQALKKLARVKYGNAPSDAKDGILSNEVFERIKELKAKEEARIALTHNGFKLPSSEQLRVKRVHTAKLDAKIKQKLTKEQKLALIRAGREERGEYQARTAIKRRKTGGLSNEQKVHKKAMPLAAKRAKVAKSIQEKKKRAARPGKQFRGRKAWK